jgi:beta-glucanase (GH16 family)
MLSTSSLLFLSFLKLSNVTICSTEQITKSVHSQTTTSPDSLSTKYKLVWSDEFNGTGKPDSRYWSNETGLVRNHEDQWYQQENAKCKNGILIIEARRAQLKNPNYSKGSVDWKKNRQLTNYTSSSINTSGKKSWTYSRFVMRAKIDTNSGIWPAFWTLGVAGKWPANGEIDIMEYYRGKILANIACASNDPTKPEWFSTTKAVSTFKEKDWASKFHIWRMDWDANAISLYVDDLLLNHVELSKLDNKDGSKVNPFRKPHYILLNLAIGGDNGGTPRNTVFPRRLEVDYVRVYQK